MMTVDRKPVTIAVLFVLALAIRLAGIDFGLPAMNDPDELMFELGAIRMISHHTLNPGWFGHPATTTMYALAVVNAVVLGFGKLVGWFPTVKAFANAVYLNPGWVILPGRWIMAVFGAGSVWATYRLTDRLFGPGVALVAGLMLAVNPVAVAWAQVVRSDIMATFFMLLSLDAAVRVARRQAGDAERDVLWGALWLALAIASKWPFGLGGLAMAGALWIAHHHRQTFTRAQTIAWAMGFGVATLACLVAISPYLVLAHDVVLRNLKGEAQLHHLGATGGTPLENAWWYLRDPLLRALGVVGGVLAAIGLGVMARHRETRVMILPMMGCLAVVICIQHLIWERWALPLMPFLAMATALGIRAVARLVPARPGVVAGALTLAGVAPLVLADVAQAHQRTHDTRQLASRWAIAHIPAGSQVLLEHFGFDLLAQPWNLMFPLGRTGCTDARAILQGRIDYSKIESDRGGQSNVDFGTMPAARAAQCHPDYAILTQYDRYAAERGDFPSEYQSYRQLIARGTVVATIAPTPGVNAGPTIRILHFDRDMAQSGPFARPTPAR